MAQLRMLATAFCLLIFLVHSSMQQTCNTINCVAPACRCMGTGIPGGLSRANTPQLVFLTFDGAITQNTITNYTTILTNRFNPNGCPISATFFVNHEYNDYALTHELFYKGQEIATHTVSHSLPAADWATKTTKEWVDEIGGQRAILARYANIPIASIRGAKAPFLQSSGDNTIAAMMDPSTGMLYDSSYPTTVNTDPAVWPYTLDRGFPQDCLIEPCPRAQSQFPGVWTVPMVAVTDPNNTKCSMIDNCVSRPRNRSETYNFLVSNFQRHYLGSKAPFGAFLTANAWFSYGYTLDGYLDFLNYLSTLDDVYIVSMGRGLDWMKNPVPLNQAGATSGPFGCPTVTVQPCSKTNCYYDEFTSCQGEQRMVSCIQCPIVYPWTRNPTGDPALLCQ